MFVIASSNHSIVSLLSRIYSDVIVLNGKGAPYYLIPNNEIVITDTSAYINFVRNNLLKEGNRNILVFISGTYNRFYKGNISLSYKEEFLLGIIDTLIHHGSDVNSFIPVEIMNNTQRDSVILEGNIKLIPEELMDIIVSFLDYFEVGDKVDRAHIIISSSEIIDNIVEANISLNRSSAKVRVDLMVNSEMLIIRINDYLGMSDIYEISKSIESEGRNNIIGFLARNDFIQSIPVRGRGYTLMMQTSDMVITRVMKPESIGKYKQQFPFTETSIVYFFKDCKRKQRIGVVIEYV
ncbi:MAG: hypothetical protein N3D81_07645 [Spirochaetes bacterium]|nr:hypothetical protein [Spirochaetota bacterium]